MTKLKKKLNVLFYKIFLKFYSSMKNVTSEPMSLDLVREEIQMFIFVTLVIELKLLLNSIAYCYSKKMNTSLLVDVFIKFLVVSSKEKILYRLGLSGYTSLDNSNKWIVKKIQVEEYSSIVNLLNLIYAKELNDSIPINLIVSLIENLVIKLTSVIVYEIFSGKNLSKFVVLKCYTIDYLLFSYSVTNLKTYLYWKSYIQSTYSNIKRFSTNTYPLLICTKNGIESKKLYNRNLVYSTNSSEIQAILSKSIDFMEYLCSHPKIGM